MKFNLFLILFVVFIVSCDDDETTTNNSSILDDLNLVASIDDSTHTINIYSENNKLVTGYNELYFETLMNGEKLNLESIEIIPRMEMNSGMTHSAPHYSHIIMDGLIKKPIVFVMPSGGGNWFIDADFEFEDHNHSFEIPIEVEASEYLKSFTYEDTGYFVSLMGLDSPVVGSNNIHFTVHKRENMMNWPAVEDLAIEIEPWMPSMGHGSSGNENPVFKESSNFYEGIVNFNMTGDWEIRVDLKQNMSDTISIGNVVFNLTF